MCASMKAVTQVDTMPLADDCRLISKPGTARAFTHYFVQHISHVFDKSV